MTTMTLTVDNKNIDLLEAFKILASKFEGVTFEINKEETKEEVLSSFKQAMKDIKSGDMIKNSISSKDFFKEFTNG
jgi:hypothetical protein